MSEIELNSSHDIDCIDAMKQIPAGFIDLVVADPPFAVGFKAPGPTATGGNRLD